MALCGDEERPPNSHPPRSCECHLFGKKVPGERETVFFPPIPTDPLGSPKSFTFLDIFSKTVE